MLVSCVFGLKCILGRWCVLYYLQLMEAMSKGLVNAVMQTGSLSMKILSFLLKAKTIKEMSPKYTNNTCQIH